MNALTQSILSAQAPPQTQYYSGKGERERKHKTPLTITLFPFSKTQILVENA
jgi:hypothetical protein